MQRPSDSSLPVVDDGSVSIEAQADDLPREIDESAEESSALSEWSPVAIVGCLYMARQYLADGTQDPDQ